MRRLSDNRVYPRVAISVQCGGFLHPHGETPHDGSVAG